MRGVETRIDEDQPNGMGAPQGFQRNRGRVLAGFFNDPVDDVGSAVEGAVISTANEYQVCVHLRHSPSSRD